MRSVLFLAALALPTTALADQCQWVSEDVARAAIKVLADQQQVVDFCEPCGADAPSEPREITSLGFAPASDAKFYEVSVNGAAVDLAYLYAGGKNVAKAASCETTGVSPELPASNDQASQRPPK